MSEKYIYRVMEDSKTGDSYIEELSFSEEYNQEQGPYKEVARFASEKEAKEFLKSRKDKTI